MPTVVGIEFNPVTKVYHFGANQLLDLAGGEYVIVETAKGAEIAKVVEAPHTIDDRDIVGEMKNVVRRASAWDLVQKDVWMRKEQEALEKLGLASERIPLDASPQTAHFSSRRTRVVAR